MTTTEIPTDAERQEAFAGRIVTSLVETLELMNIHVGLDLGLYPLLREAELTPAQLAERAGIHPRYAREWLQQQAVAGVVDVAVESDDDESRAYRLPAPHAEALCDETHPAYVAGAVLFLPAVQALPAVVDAYRTGRGVSFGDFGDGVRNGQSAFNRPAFTNDLSGWLTALPDVEAKLRSGTARVADVGCGTGWSTIALAAAFQTLRVDGIDLDDASIADARKHAADAGVTDRVTFEVRDAADPKLEGRYDLVTVFEAIHDMARPVEVLRSIRGLLAEGGVLLVMDENVPDAFPGATEDPFVRLFYAASPVHCLPVGMVGDDPVGTGTVMTQATFSGYAAAAGFSRCEVLPIEHPMFRFYRVEG
jgi:SAM-dependent methyltransferase